MAGMTHGEEEAKQWRFRRLIQFRLRSFLLIVLVVGICLWIYPTLRLAMLRCSFENAKAERDAALKAWKIVHSKRELGETWMPRAEASVNDRYFRARSKLESAYSSLVEYDGSINRD